MGAGKGCYCGCHGMMTAAQPHQIDFREAYRVLVAKLRPEETGGFTAAKLWQRKVLCKLVTWHHEEQEFVVTKLRPSRKVHQAAEINRPCQSFQGAREAATNPQL